MPPVSNNLVLTHAAARALRAEFIGWQCRVRQLAAREQGGRPTGGMRPRVVDELDQLLAEGIVTLLVESEPEHSTTQFRYDYLKTEDPHERYEKALQFLQAGYFQEPRRFSDVLTALFTHDARLSLRLLDLRRCVLLFEQYTQGYRVPCSVARLPVTHRLYQATYWHNRLFNPHLPAEVDILAFTPDWSHAAGFRRETDTP